MLMICQPDLQKQDFDRLEAHIAALVESARWTRRAGRLVLQVRGSDPDTPALKALADDPAIEWVLSDPSPEETARLFSRRDLLDVALATTGLLTAGCLAGPVGLYLNAPPAYRGLHGDVLVAKVDALPVGGAVSRIVDGDDVIVIRRNEKTFVALSATCTHSEACLVEWDGARRQLLCPCHRGVFDVFGNVVSGPPPRPLTTFETVIREGNVYMRRRR